MLHISKKALLLANLQRWVGTLILFLYIPMFILGLPGKFIPLVVGCILATRGGLQRTDLYLCPKCGTRILRGGTIKDVLSRNIPDECYMCGKLIQIELDD